MDIRFPGDKTVEIRMDNHIEEAIEAFDGDTTQGVQTPASKGLFKIDQASFPLNKKDAEVFHHIVAKMFLCM